jgi:hypothetical protein
MSETTESLSAPFDFGLITNDSSFMHKPVEVKERSSPIRFIKLGYYMQKPEEINLPASASVTVLRV